MTKQNKVFLLAIGNDILGDDGIAPEVADSLKKEYAEEIYFETIFGGGLELLDLLEGKKRVIILDSIVTGKNPPGTVMELSLDEFHNSFSGSPHYMGLPEVLRLSRILEIPFPEQLKILAIETEVQNEVRQGLSPQLQILFPKIVSDTKYFINQWIE